MKTIGEYVIRLSGLDESFEFELGKKFFAGNETGEWDGGEVQAVVVLHKNGGAISLEFRLKGLINVVCDRCLGQYLQPIDSLQTLYIKFGEERKEMDDNVLVIPREDHQIEISHFLYEFLLLALPMRRVHPDDSDGNSSCEKEMIRKLEKHLIIETKKAVDPRWEELKKLIDKN